LKFNQSQTNHHFVTPPLLKKGDKVGIIALASKVNFEDLKKGISVLEKQWGLEVVVGQSVKSVFNGFAGTDQIRAADFQTMLDNVTIKAIFSARGGYGCSRIIDDISFETFQQHPKWVVGFSDITIVHAAIQNLGFQSIHGAMPRTYGKRKTAIATESVRKILFGEAVDYTIKTNTPQFCQDGHVKAPIIGGNLTMLVNTLGTPSELDFNEKILFLEDIDEYLYNTDRQMVQLKRAGKLKNLAGLIIGHFTNPKENSTPFGKTATEIILEHVNNPSLVVAAGFPVGHEDHNLAIPCGREVTLTVEGNILKLRE
jgi:muramoyltetrapeptide carboxypeptidase